MASAAAAAIRRRVSDTRGPGVTRKWGGCQPTLVIHALHLDSELSGGVGCSPPSPPIVGRGTLG